MSTSKTKQHNPGVSLSQLTNKASSTLESLLRQSGGIDPAAEITLVANVQAYSKLLDIIDPIESEAPPKGTAESTISQLNKLGRILHDTKSTYTSLILDTRKNGPRRTADSHPLVIVVGLGEAIQRIDRVITRYRSEEAMARVESSFDARVEREVNRQVELVRAALMDDVKGWIHLDLKDLERAAEEGQKGLARGGPGSAQAGRRGDAENGGEGDGGGGAKDGRDGGEDEEQGANRAEWDQRQKRSEERYLTIEGATDKLPALSAAILEFKATRTDTLISINGQHRTALDNIALKHLSVLQGIAKVQLEAERGFEERAKRIEGHADRLDGLVRSFERHYPALLPPNTAASAGMVTVDARPSGGQSPFLSQCPKPRPLLPQLFTTPVVLTTHSENPYPIDRHRPTRPILLGMTTVMVVRSSPAILLRAE